MHDDDGDESRVEVAVMIVYASWCQRRAKAKLSPPRGVRYGDRVVRNDESARLIDQTVQCTLGHFTWVGDLRLNNFAAARTVCLEFTSFSVVVGPTCTHLPARAMAVGNGNLPPFMRTGQQAKTAYTILLTLFPPLYIDTTRELARCPLL